MRLTFREIELLKFVYHHERVLNMFTRSVLHMRHDARPGVFSFRQRPQWTRFVRPEADGYRFPLSRAYSDANATLEGIEAAVRMTRGSGRCSNNIIENGLH